MVGSALMRRLAREDCELVTVGRDQLDLRQQAEVQAWMNEAKPDVVILAAARVGGIHANASRPADFLDDNLAMQTNVIHCAHEFGVRASCCFWDRRASIRAWRRNRSAKPRC
jgi:GDP-L-fucose synthase